MTGFSLRTIRQICSLKEEVEENVWHIQAPVESISGERFKMMLQHIAELYPVNDQLMLAAFIVSDK